ncbi:MAG: cobaltochelatase subunit CobN [Cyanobacteriota bacterium]|nr:cobaltochelatase subunit CobN [Cyanobacteriota bacterium]
MHRLAAQPGSYDPSDQGLMVEQSPAPVLLLSSADTDLRSLAALQQSDPDLLGCALRCLNLAALSSPAVIDHYISSTAASAQLVVIRLLGGRGHWSYGLERFQRWAQQQPGRQLVVLSGTAEEDSNLGALGTAPLAWTCALSCCWREGGPQNLASVLRALRQLLEGRIDTPAALVRQPDPLPHDWRQDAGPKVGVVLYRALLQAGDLAWMEALLQALRQRGLCPRALWVSGLRDPAVADGVLHLLAREGVDAVLCGTAFASVQAEAAALGAPLWDQLGVPVFQILASTLPRSSWEASSIGLGPLDLSLQIALPELDGRITTRVGAFKEAIADPAGLDAGEAIGTALHSYNPDRERLEWISTLCANWITLRRTPATARRVGLVLANYPTRNSRLANGVGLDTPASTALMLRWLADAGYQLEQGTGAAIPADGEALIGALLAGRSNDPESDHRPALDHLSLASYERWYRELPAAAIERLEQRWGPPQSDQGLGVDASGQPAFAIRGLRLGQVVVLIQPERGYDRDPALSYHCPDLPPTHAYLAQYLWLRETFGAHAVVHVGKHGNLEWLPGKGLGLSPQCFPELALGPLPHLYPFIVNDPGEGSQAKRRSQAVILDHLTPPLGRAGLHGAMLELESLLDEYWEAQQLGSQRLMPLRQRLQHQLGQLKLQGLIPGLRDGAGTIATGGGDGPNDEQLLEAWLDAADGYLCELKEAQIRLGLHTYGTLPETAKACELLLALARPPQAGLPGLTQALAQDLGLRLDPWADADEDALAVEDQRLLQPLRRQGDPGLRKLGDGVALLERWALELIDILWQGDGAGSAALDALGPTALGVLEHVRDALMPRLRACPSAERQALLDGLNGRRIPAGPSGAPTRGRPDLLPTGRNFYSVDLRGLPTEVAWDLGRRSAELLLELHLQEQGEHLRNLALSVWGTATMRNGGEDIAQALALMGVRPVWDGPSRRLLDLEVIPLTLLQRPRVDVTLRISGLFRDAFPQLVGWFNRATSLIAACDESPEDNPLAQAARLEGHADRIYGSAPGSYGAGLQGLIDSGHWQERGDLGEAFLNWSSWRYVNQEHARPDAGGIAAIADRSGLEARLAGVQVVLHNQDNREHDLLDSDDYYQFQGGLSAAVERVRGQRPALWFGDHSRAQRPRLHRLEREVDKVLRSRLLNPRWIDAMASHGYKGGFEMAASLDYLFAYDASTGRMPDWGYGAIQEAWLDAPAVRTFLERSNPWALRDMAERLLEAHHRGLWRGCSPEALEQLKQTVLSSEALTEGH